MKHLILGAIALSCVCLVAISARASFNEDHKMTGVLIDNACGADKADEAAAAKHSVKCCLKDSCAASGFQLIVGDKHYKLDTAGNVQAVAYLKTAKSTRATIGCTVDGDVIKVIAITAVADAAK